VLPRSRTPGSQHERRGLLQRAGAVWYPALIRWAFARFYREFAWTYNFVAWVVSRGLWRRWTLAALPYLRGRVLEVGCGTGYVQEALATQPRGGLVGLDASPQMLALTQRRLQRRGGAARLVRGVSQALPLTDSAFQTVLATFPSEYIVQPQTLTEIQRVLQPSGQLIIVDAAWFTHDGLYARLVDIAYRLTFQRPVRGTPDYRPYLALLERAGFAVAGHWETVGPSQVLVLVATRPEG
jgi:ubiquinone/menaquinone biosynthesis C-methylase UbiE